MARPTDTTTPTLALAGLSAAAALPLTRVYASGPWLVAIVAVAVVPPFVVWWATRRSWASAALAALLLLAGGLAAVWLVSPSTTWLSLPTWATLSDIESALSDAPETLRSASVPVPAAQSALFMAVVAVWAASSVAAWLGLRLDATVGAVVPSLALFTVVSALGKGPWLWTAAVYGATTGLFLLIQSQRLLAGSRSSFRTRGRRAGAVLVGGVAATALAVAAGSLFGSQLPGAGADPLLDYRDFGGGGGRSKLSIVSPLIDIRSSLIQQTPIEMFRVRASSPAYWRVISLEDFDGRYWGLSDDSVPASSALGASARAVSTVEVRQDYELRALGGHLLPAAFEPVAVDASAARVLPETSTIVRDEVTAGMRYRATSQVPSPTPEELDAARAPTDTGADELTRLPDDFPDSVRELAASVTAGAGGAYDELRALQDWFRTQFIYNLAVEPGHSSADIEEFVLVNREGYCEQFAGSFAAMARSLGYPARVAVGFTPGDRTSGDEYVVTGRDAHAWPEVFLDGAGWISFEPTPSRFEPSVNDHTGTGAEAIGSLGNTDSPLEGGSSVTPPQLDTPNSQIPDLGTLEDRLPDGEVSTTEPSAAGGSQPRWRDLVDSALLENPARTLVVVLLAGLAAAIATMASIVAAKRFRLRRRRHEPDPRLCLEGAWSEAGDRLVEAGIEPDPAMTPTEFALRRAAARGAGAAGGALMELARLITAARYAPEPPANDTLARAWDASDRVAAGLRAQATTAVRLKWLLGWRALRRREPIGAS